MTGERQTIEIDLSPFGVAVLVEADLKENYAGFLRRMIDLYELSHRAEKPVGFTRGVVDMAVLAAWSHVQMRDRFVAAYRKGVPLTNEQKVPRPAWVKCGNCAFSDAITGREDNPFRLCRFNAPRSGHVGWPQVNVADWCSEFRSDFPIDKIK